MDVIIPAPNLGPNAIWIVAAVVLTLFYVVDGANYLHVILRKRYNPQARLRFAKYLIVETLIYAAVLAVFLSINLRIVQ